MELRKLFSPTGRIGGMEYFFTSVGCIYLFCISVIATQEIAGALGLTNIERFGISLGGEGFAHDGITQLAALAFAFLIWIPASMKAAHNKGWSGWPTALLIVPFFANLLSKNPDGDWTVFLSVCASTLLVSALVVLPSDPGPNRYGRPPDGSPFPRVHSVPSAGNRKQ